VIRCFVCPPAAITSRRCMPGSLQDFLVLLDHRVAPGRRAGRATRAGRRAIGTAGGLWPVSPGLRRASHTRGPHRPAAAGHKPRPTATTERWSCRTVVSGFLGSALRAKRLSQDPGRGQGQRELRSRDARCPAGYRADCGCLGVRADLPFAPGGAEDLLASGRWVPKRKSVFPIFG
jgi:hypothetical protein